VVIWRRSIFPHEDLLEFGSLGHHIWQLDAIGSELAMTKDHKFEHFKLEHMWSSRNFRIEPPNKENDTNVGPGVYYFWLGY
jgi:hypothetical protein